MGYWRGIEPVESKELFRMPGYGQTKLSKENNFFKVLGLGGALDT